MKETESLFSGVGRFYLKGLRRFGAFLVFVIGSLLAGAVVILPIWLLAEHATRVFTIFALVCIAGGLLFLIIRRVIISGRTRPQSDSPGFIRFLWNFGSVIGLLFIIYLSALYILRGNVPLFVVMLIVFFTALGLYLYARKKSRA
jgi:hypothetical protein